MKKYTDITNLLVIAVTFILFFIALFTKGFTHDLLLEAGILLVSIKLIMMNRTNKLISQEIIKKLGEIEEKFTEKNITES